MPVNLAFLGFMVFIFAGENIMKFFLIHFSPASVRIVLENVILIHRDRTIFNIHHTHLRGKFVYSKLGYRGVCSLVKSGTNPGDTIWQTTKQPA
jgi:hypothetical protein